MEERIKQIFKFKKFIFVGIAAALVLCFVLGIALSKEGKVTTIAESSLKETIELGELSTIEYTYNSTLTVYDNDKNKTEKYHVAYNGSVKAGFDFKQIKVKNHTERKKIIITIPEIIITSVNVNPNSLDYIFLKDKYNEENTYQEAYKKCKADLKKKADKNSSLKKLARENAIETVKALLKPYEEQLEEGYSIEVK